MLRQVTAATTLTLLAGLTVASTSAADRNWPQFRGPTGQGHSVAEGVPIRWSERENIVWRTPVSGRGHSSPVVWGDQVWVTTAAENGTALGAVALDFETGDQLFSVTLFRPADPKEIHQDNSYASPTPVIAEGRMFCHFGRYGTACLDTSTGEVIWRNDQLVIEHEGGPGSSPVLFEDLLIVNCDGSDEQYVVALDVETGGIRWRQDRSAPFRKDPVTHRAFSTPLIVLTSTGAQLISPGADQIEAYDPASGRELWQVRFEGFSTVPCPVADGDVVYFCTGFFKPQLWAVATDGQGDVTETHIKWKFRGSVPETPSPLIHNGRIYLVSNTGVGTVIDAESGERVSQFRIGGNYSASPLLAGEHIYFFNQEGLSKVYEPGDRPNMISANRLAGGIRATPAVSGTALILRTDEAVYRIEDESADAR